MIRICLIATGNTPGDPPCGEAGSPDTVIGSGPSTPQGEFSITVPPLEAFQCIYPYDTCTGLVGSARCAQTPAPAPALSPLGTALAFVALMLVAILGLARLPARR